MKILRKAVALLLTALLAFSSLSVVASAGDPGTNLTIEIRLFRNNGTDWVEVGPDNKTVPGEAIKARVYVGTDYLTNDCTFMFFHTPNFFETNYNSGETMLTTNPTVGSVAHVNSLSATAIHSSTGLLNNRVTAGNFPASYITNPQSDIYVVCDFANTQPDFQLIADEWLFELDLRVKNTPTMDAYGSVFIEPTTIKDLSTLGQTGDVDVPKGAENNLDPSLRASMSQWDASVTLLNTAYGGTNDLNFGSIESSVVFDANGGSFAPDSALTKTYSGRIDTELDFDTTVTEPTLQDMTFVGWYPADFAGTPTADDCIDRTHYTYDVQNYKALWTNATTTVTFDANGGTGARFDDFLTTRAIETSVGIAFSAPTNPVWTGHDFQGWWTKDGSQLDGSNNPDYGTEVTTFVGPESSVTYYAKWNPRTGTNYRFVCHYTDYFSNNTDAQCVLKEFGTTGDTVNVVETLPAPAAGIVNHTFDDIDAQLAAKGLRITVDRDNTNNDLTGVIAGNGSLELHLYCDTIEYTATFNPNGGTFEGGSTVNYETTQPYGQAIVAPPAVAKAHNTFNGWSPAFDATAGAIMQGNREYVAQWTPVEYSAEFYLNSVDAAAGTNCYDHYDEPFGETINTPPVPQVGGQVFLGWSTDGTTVITTGLVMDAEGKVFIAVWEDAQTFSATFDANGGTFADATTTKTGNYAQGELIPAPGTVTRNNYTFLYWYDVENDAEYNPGVTTMGTESVTYTAQWAMNVKVTYILNGATYQEFDTYEGAEPFPVPANNPTVLGNTFDGWQAEDGRTPADFNFVPEAGMTFIAQLTPDATEYTVTYAYTGTVPEGAPAVPVDTNTYSVNADVPVLAEPTLANYIFTGWLYNNVDVTTFKMPNNNVTLTGSWAEAAADQYTITYYTVGETVYTTSHYAEGATIVPPSNPTMTGMQFSGWTTDATLQTSVALPATMPANAISAYAMWTPNQYVVSYMVEGTEYQTYPEVAFGSQIPVPADPTREGYIFAGWSPAAPATMPANNLTFTAQWNNIPGPGEYTVTYKSMGTTYKSYVVTEGAVIPVPEEDPTLFGHNFVGWTPEAPAAMPAENLEFTAQWEVDKTFVTIVIGGTVIAGGAIATAAAIGTGITVSVIGGVIVVGLIAHALADTYTVTYMVDGTVYKTYKVLAGAKIPVPGNPTKSGYSFANWKPAVPERMPENDLTFEAQWTKVSASVDDEIPQTGSVAGGITVFAFISAAAAAAYITLKKKNATV